MPGSSSSQAEVDLIRLIEQTEIFLAEGVRRSPAGGSEPIAPDDFPKTTLAMLVVQTWTDGRAALLLLRDPELSHSAPALVRSMTEALAHVLWIAANLAESPCRAICLEKGMAKAWQDQINSSPELFPEDSKLKAGANRAVQAHLRLIAKDYKKYGCACAARNWSDVQDTLQAVRIGHRPPFFAIWKECSVAAHGMRPHRMLRRAGQYAVMGGPSSYRFRFTMLRYIQYVFLELSKRADLVTEHDLQAHGSNIGFMNMAARGMDNDPVSVSGRRGEFDRE